MAPDFRLFEVLARHGVPFLVIGGHAVSFHGYVRATEDTDVLWVRSPDAEAGLLAALDELHAEYIGSEIDPATGVERTYPITASFIRSQPLMMLCTSAGFLDLFDYVPDHPGVAVASLLASSAEAEGVRFISLEWLRRLKAAAGRPKDLLDLQSKRKITGAQVRGKAEEKIQEIRKKIDDLKQMETSLLRLSKICGEGEQAIRECRVFDCFETGCKGGDYATTSFD